MKRRLGKKTVFLTTRNYNFIVYFNRESFEDERK